MEGFGVIVSERRTFPATLMPEGNDFQEPASDAVVDEVSNAAQIQPSNDFYARYLYLGAYARFFHQEFKGRLEIFAYCSGRGWSVV